MTDLTNDPYAPPKTIFDASTKRRRHYVWHIVVSSTNSSWGFWMLLGVCNLTWPHVTTDETFATVLPWALPSGAICGVLPGVAASWLFSRRKLRWTICLNLLAHLIGLPVAIGFAIGMFTWPVVFSSYVAATVVAMTLFWVYLRWRYPLRDSNR